MPKTNQEVYDAVLDVKSDVIDLKRHVNDRNEAIENSLVLMQAQLLEKADKTQLLQSYVFKALAKPTIRWGLGVVATTILATTITGQHWLPTVRDWLGYVTY